MPSSLPQPDSTGIHRVNPLLIPDWDERIAQFPNAGIFHSAAWARVLHDTYGYEPCYLVRGSSDRPEAVLPLMEVSSPLTGRRGVSLPFTDAVDPLGENPADLFAAAQSLARERDWKYLECRGARAAFGPAAASTSFYRHVLALNPDTNALLTGCDEAVRRALRKAERSDLAIDFSQNESAVTDFYGLLCLTRRRHGLPPQPFPFFAAVQRHLLAANHGWVVLARRGGRPVAGAIFFHQGREALYKFGASDDSFQELRPNNLVMWSAIRHYAQKGFLALDFGRTSLDHAGLRRFKLGWGTTESPLDYVRLNTRTGEFLKVPDSANGWHNRVFHHLPTWASRAVGAVLYRHMA